MALGIQIALQGGGARIVLLLAAAETLQEFENYDKEIEITQIAGTSAGAIVGALLAAKCRIDQAKASLLSPAGTKLLKQFPRPMLPVALWKAWRGKPFWSHVPLEDWLVTQFEASPIRRRKGSPLLLGDLKQPLLKVVSSDLRNPAAGSHGPNDDLVGALLASSGLPFCFRSWRYGPNTTLVDGGLCENLPVAQLQVEDEVKGPVIAFSFDEKTAATSAGILDYGLSLMSTAIGHSVQSAQSRLEEDSVFSLSATPSINTFDFKTAQAFLSGQGYQDTKKAVRAWLHKFINDHRYGSSQHVTRDVWLRPSGGAFRDQMRRIGKLYKSVHEPQRIRFHRFTTIITANSLAPAGSAAFGKDDEATLELVVEPIDAPIGAHRFSLSTPITSSFFGHYSLSVTDKSGAAVEFQALASIAPDGAGDRQLVVFFMPPLPVGSGIYTFRLQDSGQNLLDPLVKAGTDGFDLSFARAGAPLDWVEMAIHVPLGYPQLTKSSSNIAHLDALKPVPSTVGLPPLDFRTHAWGAADVVPSKEDQHRVLMKFKR